MPRYTDRLTVPIAPADREAFKAAAGDTPVAEWARATLTRAARRRKPAPPPSLAPTAAPAPQAPPDPFTEAALEPVRERAAEVRAEVLDGLARKLSDALEPRP
jgi:hypothetical protein